MFAIRALLLVTLTCAVAFGQQQRIDSVSPSQGPIAGGTIVTIKGANLAGSPVVLDHAAIAALSQSNSEVRLQMPKHDNGYALIQVGSAAAEFLYLPPKLEDLQAGSITTVAGVGKYLRLELPATQSMVYPSDVTIAPDGQIYFMQTDRGLLFRLSSDGILHHVAGTLGTFDFSVIGDGGPGRDAVFAFARSVAVDAAENAYITDVRSRVRKVDAATGMVSTVAGTGELGFSGDGGPAAMAKIGEPSRIACSPDGTLYFLEGQLINGGGSPRVVHVRKVTPAGIITTIAGDGTIGEGGDGGPATSAQLNIGVTDAGDIAIDSDQNVFILEHDGGRIRRVDAHSGIISTFASLLFPAGDPRNGSSLNPAAMAIDSGGNVWAATTWNLRKFDRAGSLLAQWDRVGFGFSPDGTPLTQMSMDFGPGMAVAANGDIIYSAPGRLRRINATTQKVETIAGIGGNVIGVPGPALGAVLTGAFGDIAVLPSGDPVFSDGDLNWIFRLDRRTGNIVPFAGGSGDLYEESPALATKVAGLRAVKSDGSGNVYLADSGAVRMIDANGIVHRVAGVGGGSSGPPQYDFAGDGGPAVKAHVCQPLDVVPDRNRNIYIADTNNNRIRRIDARTGTITTVAGSGASNGFEGYGRGDECGDGGPATTACLNTPVAVAVRDDGTMYINDFGAPKAVTIRKVTPDGIITSLHWPLTTKLIAGPGGSIVGHGMSLIYRVDDDRVRFVAGGSTPGFAGDGGSALQAKIAPGEMELANGIAVDSEGNLFIYDTGNRRVRVVRYGAVLAPPNATIQATASASTIRATVLDANGSPAPGIRVDFTAPAIGPSCHFPNNANTIGVVTDQTGVATTSCVPNCIGNGSFIVTAQPLTATATAGVTLSDTASPCRRRAARH